MSRLVLLLSFFLLTNVVFADEGAVHEAAVAVESTVAADPHTPLDYIWILLATALVFLMQAGFMFLESGFSQSKNSINVAVKNVSDFILAVTLYWLVGYGLMFGADKWGLLGTDKFFFDPDNPWDANLFIFQAVFCGTAATITSGAVAGRTNFNLKKSVDKQSNALVVVLV